MPSPPLDFSREFPLFPLPNCVLFPGVVQPLHLFEPRYRAMMRAALGESAEGAGGAGGGSGEGGRALALALLKPGWEKDYHGTPPVHECLCAGRILAHEQLADGKYNLLLQGVVRARVLGERACAGAWGVYRMARLEPVRETDGPPSNQALQRRILRQMFEKTALKNLTVTPALAALFEDTIPAGRLIDALAFSLVQDVPAKQRLLEEPDVAARGELLLRELVALAGRLEKSAPSPKSSWPPPQGQN